MKTEAELRAMGLTPPEEPRPTTPAALRAAMDATAALGSLIVNSDPEVSAWRLAMVQRVKREGPMSEPTDPRGTVIHRHPVPDVGVVFHGPSGPVTFGYQAERKSFSIWFVEMGESFWATEYIVVGTGTGEAPEGFGIVASTVVDGFYAFHLLRRTV